MTITGSSPLLCPSRRLPKGPRRTVLPPPHWGRGAPANPEEVLLLKNSQPMLSDLFLDVDKYIAGAVAVAIERWGWGTKGFC